MSNPTCVRPIRQVKLVGDHHLVQVFRAAGEPGKAQSALTQPWLRHVQSLVGNLYNAERILTRLGTRRRPPRRQWRADALGTNHRPPAFPRAPTR